MSSLMDPTCYGSFNGSIEVAIELSFKGSIKVAIEVAIEGAFSLSIAKQID